MRGVLFDFAATLFVPRPAAEWVRAVAARTGVRLGEDEVEPLAAAYEAAGMPGGPYPAAVPEALAEAYAGRDLSPEAHRAAYVALMGTVEAPASGFAEALYELVARPEHWIPYADALHVVEALARAGIDTGVISNVGFDLRPILRAHGFDGLAEHCTLSFEHGLMKPDPALFAAALSGLGTAAEETLMVGDHAVADGGAVALGCPTLLLPVSPAGARHGLDRVLALVGARRRGGPVERFQVEALAALRGGRDERLLAIAHRHLGAGATAGELLDVAQALRERLDDEREDRLLELMDVLAGWCAPHARLADFRAATPADEPFLAAMLRLAAGWREGDPPEPAPELGRYVDGFGRAGDHGVIAEGPAGPAGAAWFRVLGELGHGFVAPGIPEVGLAVVPAARGRGIGSGLLARLLAEASAQGLPGLSLSVEPDNPALALYERAGFVKVGERGGAWTMLATTRC
jgi:FMN phosphatase YigB (HAD superfamily)/ribosomal protein S18 acetylase RimI-like enzyme